MERLAVRRGGGGTTDHTGRLRRTAKSGTRGSTRGATGRERVDVAGVEDERASRDGCACEAVRETITDPKRRPSAAYDSRGGLRRRRRERGAKSAWRGRSRQEPRGSRFLRISRRESDRSTAEDREPDRDQQGGAADRRERRAERWGSLRGSGGEPGESHEVVDVRTGDQSPDEQTLEREHRVKPGGRGFERVRARARTTPVRMRCRATTSRSPPAPHGAKRGARSSPWSAAPDAPRQRRAQTGPPTKRRGEQVQCHGSSDNRRVSQPARDRSAGLSGLRAPEMRPRAPAGRVDVALKAPSRASSTREPTCGHPARSRAAAHRCAPRSRRRTCPQEHRRRSRGRDTSAGGKSERVGRRARCAPHAEGPLASPESGIVAEPELDEHGHALVLPDRSAASRR